MFLLRKLQCYQFTHGYRELYQQLLVIIAVVAVYLADVAAVGYLLGVGGRNVAYVAGRGIGRTQQAGHIQDTAAGIRIAPVGKSLFA